MKRQMKIQLILKTPQLKSSRRTLLHVDYISGLEKDDASLKEKLKMSCFNEDSLKKHNDGVRFHTGPPNWSLLLCLFTFLNNYSPELK